jgi:hypothetical protein
MASGRKPSKLMMMARLMSALDGCGVALGVRVAAGVNVAVKVGVIVGVFVAGGVSVMVGVSVGTPVGEGTGGRELPQMLGSPAHAARIIERDKTARRFRELLQQTVVTAKHAKFAKFNGFLCILSGLRG